VHGVSQHTSSTQFPEMQSTSSVQLPPLGAGVEVGVVVGVVVAVGDGVDVGGTHSTPQVPPPENWPPSAMHTSAFDPSVQLPLVSWQQPAVTHKHSVSEPRERPTQISPVGHWPLQSGAVSPHGLQLPTSRV
jgi:hypothetical protein